MKTYTVHMNDPDDAQFLADKQGNSFHLTARGVDVMFDESAHAWFASRPEEDDGHIDTDGVMWFGGLPHPVQSQP